MATGTKWSYVTPWVTTSTYEHYWLRFAQSDAILKCERSRELWVCKTVDCLGNDRTSALAPRVST